MNELQLILDSVKQNKSGNKQVLRKRTLNLLSASSSKTKNLRQKIIQVYGSRTQQPTLHFNQLSLQQHTSRVHRQPSIYDQGSPSFNNCIQGPINNILYNKTVKFEHLPFYNSMQTLLEPMYCQTNIDSANFTGLYYLTDHLRHSIMKTWNISKQAYKLQIILRFVQIELKENVTERLPYNITVSVNGQECKLPALNIPTKAGITPWRNNVPIDITQQTDLRNCLQNELKITWSQEPYEYMASVYVAEKLTSDELLIKLKEKPIRKCENTKELITKSMESDIDMGIDSMFATLLDPLSKTRMKLPARGMHCIHLQCFDAIQFLQMNEQKQTWACPLCKKKVKFEDLEVDEFFLHILQNPNLSKTCENVILLKDGSWSEKKNREFSNSSVSNTPAKKPVEVYTLSDSDEDSDGKDKHSIKRKKYIPPQNNHPLIKAEYALAETENRTKLNNKNSSENDLVLDLSIKNGPIASTSGHNSSNIKVNGHSVPTTGSSSIFNDLYLPSITITQTNSNNSKASCSETSRNNNPQEKDKSRSVLCVITLD
ncbi:Hypothetical protein CINCED_3A010693 [Cinara cedri]|nr:Hypothetical protein CINCED_3A010693 [Cinara cedri]